ncbi:MAG TPA: FMN-binding protein [Lachnospiraceae bacterium]|jgi:electron transport complex protein RnfG|nr:RnfABCDGE type electron transport complex subunit G [Lachnospiraceae bacterium]MDY5704830.1 RnfABCDGE type electron transport complex subunit G [Lachnospiraceae bacterium]HBE07471.1 FMN-binding protein [Lachnospiraceae bacterium]
MNKMVHDALILTLITLVSGCALGVAHEVTEKPIENAQAEATKKAYQEVMPEGKTFTEVKGFDSDQATAIAKKAGFANDTINDALVAKNASGKEIGYVLTITAGGGYGGDITFSMGISSEGKMTTYSITSISETAGLGMKAKTDDPSSKKDFVDQFKGLASGNYSVVKNGTTVKENEIEGISGATITSRAMTNGVDAGFAYYESQLKGGAK